MSTKYIASNWRLPNEENSSKSDNYGLSFDPSGDYLTFTSAGDLFGNNEKFSFSFWCKVETMAAYKVFFDFSPNNFGLLALRTISTSTIELLKSGSSLGTHTFSDTTDFHHFCVVYDKTNIKLFIDTVEVISSAQTNMGNFTGLDLYLGNGYFLTSGIDAIFSEAAIFDYVLSSTQISTLYGSSSLGAGNPMALKPQPVAYYPLGDNSSGGIDAGPTSTLTQPNEAVEDASVFDFDGSDNDYLNCGNNILQNLSNSGTIDSAITFSMWFKLGSSTTSRGMLSIGTLTNSYGKLDVRHQSSAIQIVLTNPTASVEYTYSFTDTSSWHSLVIVYDPTSASNSLVYIDGVQAGSNITDVVNLAITSQNLYIGAYYGNSDTFTGQISNVAIWNSDQSSEISNIYNSGVPATTYTNTPIAWYKLDQSANWEADSTGAWQIPDAVSAYPQSFEFVPNDYIEVSDSDSLSFGNGSTDSAFSVSTWVNFDDVTNSSLFSKSNVAPTFYEYSAHISSEQIAFGLYSQGDVSGSNNIFVVTTATLTSYEGSWINLTFTYDGSRNVSGLKIYLNGDEMPTSTVENGTYVAMANTAAPFKIGRSFGNRHLNGKMSNLQVWQAELSSTQVETLYNNGTPLTTAIATDNLKAWYKLDNTATFSTNWSIPDASGNGNTGTSSGMKEQNLVNNNVSALNGESSGMTSANLVLSDLTRAVPYDSYSFDFGGLQNITIPNSTDLQAQNLTVSFWIKANAQGNYDYFLEKGNFSYAVYTGATTTDLIFFIYDGSSFYLSNALSNVLDNNWHHIAFTYNGSQIIGYKDGVANTPVSASATILYDTNPLRLFSRGTPTASNYAIGKMSNCAIFNEALTSTEVMKLYSNGVPQDLANFTPAPVAWYPLGSNSFWNGSQWTVRDMIGSNDGTGQNIGVDGLVGDAPRSEANGTGTNMDIPTNLEGSTKWSDNNSWSINMSESSRVENTP